MFWQTKGAAAGVNKLGKCLFQTEVHHLSLNSYSCELWALLQAFCRSEQPCYCKTDCASFVSQVNFIIANLYIPADFLHFEWWTFLLQIYIMRLEVCSTPLSISWIPSHLLEDFPTSLITFQQAIQAGSSWEDIFCNRRADFFAKQGSINQVDRKISEKQRAGAISDWQIWIALVNSRLSEISAVDEKHATIRSGSDTSPRSEVVSPETHFVTPNELTFVHPLQCFQQIFPKWIWQPEPHRFSWRSNFTPCCLKSYAAISKENWDMCISFLNSLVWIQEPQLKTAYVELAFGAWYQNIRFPGIPDNPKEYAQLIRKCINQCCKKAAQGNIIPGDQMSQCKSLGRTLPAGYISNGWPMIQCGALKQLALYAIAVNSQKLGDWGTPFN